MRALVVDICGRECKILPLMRLKARASGKRRRDGIEVQIDVVWRYPCSRDAPPRALTGELGGQTGEYWGVSPIRVMITSFYTGILHIFNISCQT